MLPHAEMDSYKLQVELLQERLKRSEENRERLQKKLENAIHKKAEQEKIDRAKQRQKYEEFVNELEKRNERNRQLMQMLERIDQQTAALSARSERLRTMKMQYEMYFAKLVQSQTMRFIQGATSNLTAATIPTPFPILLPTAAPTQQQQSSIITATPIKNNEQNPTTPAARATATATAATPSAIYQCDASGNLIAAGSVIKPASYAPSPRRSSQTASEVAPCNAITPSAGALPTLTAETQHWTLAMATPTPSGMLLTTAPTPMGVIPTPTPAAYAAADFISVPAYEYMQYPLESRMPRMGHLLQPKPEPKPMTMPMPKPNTPLFSDESDDLLQPMATNTKFEYHFNTNNEKEEDNGYPYTYPHPYTEENNNIRLKKDIGSLNQLDLPTRQLNDGKSKGIQEAAKILRPENENKQQHQQLQQSQKPKQLLSNMSTTSLASSLTLDKLPRTMTMTEHDSAAIDERNNDADDGEKPQLPTCFDERSKDINIIGCEDKGALETARRSDEEKTTPTYDVIGTSPATIISNDNGNASEARSRRDIDRMMSPKQQQQQQQPQLQQLQQRMTQSWHTPEGGVETTPPHRKDGASNNVDLTAGFLEYADDNITRNNIVGGNSEKAPKITPAAQMSIEKIENEIYGELVNPPINELDKNLARNAAQGLLNELVTQQDQSENQQIALNEKDNATYYGGSDPYENIAEYDQSSNENYNPTYATIEETTAAEVYTQPGEEIAYANDQNASTNYAQYSNEPQQEYSNIDYGNYDGTFDPNAYPGYTYDAITGEYTPDPAQQYTNEGDVAESYDTQVGYEQQQYETSQSQDYDYGSNYAQPEIDTTNAALAETAVQSPAAEQPDAQETTESNVELSTAPVAGSGKPTSILSSTEKHSTANDAPKKKKRVNFVDSSETDESSGMKKQNATSTGAGSESDFDFSSTSDKSGGSGGV